MVDDLPTARTIVRQVDWLCLLVWCRRSRLPKAEAPMRRGVNCCGLAAVLALGACVSRPTGPTVMVLPGQNKPFETFQQEDTSCRQYASSQGGYQQQYDIYYVQCMYAHGNYVSPYGYRYPSYRYY
jgi:hypothetical protein